MRITTAASQIADWLGFGYYLTPGQFTYSVPAQGSIWPGYGNGEETDSAGFGYADAAMATAFLDAIALWDDLIAPDFSLLPDNAGQRGEVRIAQTDMISTQVAYAYYPTLSGNQPGDVWFNAGFGPWDWSKGNFDFYAMVHEVGHVIGLEHTFDQPTVPRQFESQRYSVMSYTPVEDYFVSFGWSGDEFFATFAAPYPQTPMVLDIAAAQAIYGADRETRAGTTTYRFDQWAPGLQTIYDAGGKDTLDLSQFTLANHIDLEAGAYSSIGMATVDQQIAYWSERFPGEADFIDYIFRSYMPAQRLNAYEFTDNLAIALGTVIENATGGSGDDSLFGNAHSNRLIGGAGDDILVGRGGSDWLEGGDGDDILIGDADQDSLAPADAVAAQTLLQSAPAQFGLITAAIGTPDDVRPAPDDPSGGLRVTSGPLKDPTAEPVPSTSVPSGDTDPEWGRDTLHGGAGDDILIGGKARDVAVGGSGADLFRFADGDMPGKTSYDSDVIRDFSFAEGDRIDLSGIDAIAGGGNDPFHFIGADDFSGNAGELRYEAYSNHLLLTADVTGDGMIDFALRLDGLNTISASAFIF